jgi:hypothetical protein
VENERVGIVDNSKSIYKSTGENKSSRSLSKVLQVVAKIKLQPKKNSIS